MSEQPAMYWPGRDSAARRVIGRMGLRSFDVRPSDRTCARCGHQWPHGAVLVTRGRDDPPEPDSWTESEWAADFCEACDDPCPENFAMDMLTERWD